MRILKRQFLRNFVFSMLLSFSVAAFLAPASCRLTEEGIEIIDADTTAPSLTLFRSLGESLLLLQCSERVWLSDLFVVEQDGDDFDDLFDRRYEKIFAVASAINYSSDGKSAQIEISEPTSVGKAYLLFGKASDLSGNSLDFCQRFSGFNPEPAVLIFNEIRTTYNKSKQAVEFVEFYVLGQGNTFGLEYVSAANGEDKKYVFPPLEVKSGDYITLHGRILEGMEADAVDELDDNLALSKAYESCDTARDLWRAGSDKIVSNTDVVILRDTFTNEIKDAVLLSAAGKTNWTNNRMKDFSAEAFSLGIWDGGSSPEYAVCTEGMSSSVARSISRKNTAELSHRYAAGGEGASRIKNSASDWMVTDSQKINSVTLSGATPGYENSKNPFIAK